MHDSEQLLQYAAELEGHVDNISACWYGALQVCHCVWCQEVLTTRLASIRARNGALQVPAAALTGANLAALNPAPGLLCVVFTPESKMATDAARAILPPSVPRGDAVFNLSRTALLVHALTTGHWDELRHATQDRLHQPARAAVMPLLSPVIEAALAAGAKGV